VERDGRRCSEGILLVEMASEDLRASSYESLLAAADLFELRCKKERKDYCECKRKFLAPKKCLDLAEALHEAHSKQ
jgi:hypothetical protein